MMCLRCFTLFVGRQKNADPAVTKGFLGDFFGMTNSGAYNIFYIPIKTKLETGDAHRFVAKCITMHHIAC